MEKHLNRGVKDVIKDYPEVGDILGEFGVGCTNCEMGSCLLKDVIGIHNLSGRQEKHLMGRIEQIIYPERNITLDNEEEEEAVESSEIHYSKPLRELVEEHNNIKLLLSNIPKLCELLNSNRDEEYTLVKMSVDFIKNYADSFHHSKEEDILFSYGIKNQDIINTMLEEHKLGRWFVKLINKGIDKKDNAMIEENLRNYGELLREHIRKEDHILYPYIDRNLTEEDIKILDEKFSSINAGTAAEKYVDWAMSIDSLQLERE